MAGHPDRLHYTGNPEADRLLTTEPIALLIGFALDQQVTLQKAFSGPLDLRARIGHLDPARIAAMDPEELERAFRARPALHRFPSAMARRVQALCAVVVDEYGGDASRIWREARDGADLQARLRALPSIGPLKTQTLSAILVKQFGLSLPGLVELLPTHPTLADVQSDADREAYQARKRAHKAALRAQTAHQR